MVILTYSRHKDSSPKPHCKCTIKTFQAVYSTSTTNYSKIITGKSITVRNFGRRRTGYVTSTITTVTTGGKYSRLYEYFEVRTVALEIEENIVIGRFTRVNLELQYVPKT
jgi:hypothetical protein